MDSPNRAVPKAARFPAKKPQSHGGRRERGPEAPRGGGVGFPAEEEGSGGAERRRPRGWRVGRQGRAHPAASRRGDGDVRPEDELHHAAAGVPALRPQAEPRDHPPPGARGGGRQLQRHLGHRALGGAVFRLVVGERERLRVRRRRRGGGGARARAGRPLGAATAAAPRVLGLPLLLHLLYEYEHEADIDQTVVGDSEDGILLHGPGASPSNSMAVAMMGMADACPNVPFGEFTCQIGDESSENVDALKEDSGIGELKSEASMRPLENAEESSEVVCSGGDVTGAPFGSTHSDDLDEDKLGLVSQEIGEDDSKHSMPQSVTMDEILESESVKVVSDDNGLESEKLDQEFDSWQYENTAEAAKKLVDMVKILWSAVEPHLLKMLACLSVAGLVTVLFKYSQRSRKVNVPVSQRMPTVPPKRVPVLAPHNTVPLPVSHSEQPVRRIVPKQESSACLEPPVQSLLSESEQSVCLNVPSIGHRDHDQKVQQEDGGIERASDGSTMDHKDTDRSKPPVVQLLGEFSFVDADSSRRRPVKDSIQHGGDVTVQESVSSRKRVVKMQKDSDKIQSPGVQAARKKETTAEVEKMDATPTPLRRSSRLRKLLLLEPKTDTVHFADVGC